MRDKIIKEAISYIQSLFAGNSDGHDAAHSLRVYHNAERLAAFYPDAAEFATSHCFRVDFLIVYVK